MNKRFLLIGMLCAFQSCFGLFERYKVVNAYDRKDFAAAQTLLKQQLIDRPFDPQLLFDLGDASYRLKEFDQAQAYFAKAFEKTTDPILQQKALFNAGNTFVHKKDLRSALEQYKKVLAINRNNQDALHNKKVVEELLKQEEEQKKKEEEQKKQQEQNKKDSCQNKDQQQDEGDSSDQKEGQQGKGQGDQKDSQQSGNKDSKQKQDQQGDGEQQNNSQNEGHGQESANQNQGENNQTNNEGNNHEKSSSQDDLKGPEKSDGKENKQPENDAEKTLEEKIREQEGKQAGNERKDQPKNQQLPEKGSQKGKGKTDNSHSDDNAKDKGSEQQILHGNSDPKSEKNFSQGTDKDGQKQQQQVLYAPQEDPLNEEKDEVARIIDKIDGESGKQLFRYMVKTKMEPQYGQKNW